MSLRHNVNVYHYFSFSSLREMNQGKLKWKYGIKKRIITVFIFSWSKFLPIYVDPLEKKLLNQEFFAILLLVKINTRLDRKILKWIMHSKKIDISRDDVEKERIFTIPD